MHTSTLIKYFPVFLFYIYYSIVYKFLQKFLDPGFKKLDVHSKCFIPISFWVILLSTKTANRSNIFFLEIIKSAKQSFNTTFQAIYQFGIWYLILADVCPGLVLVKSWGPVSHRICLPLVWEASWKAWWSNTLDIFTAESVLQHSSPCYLLLSVGLHPHSDPFTLSFQKSCIGTGSHMRFNTLLFLLARSSVWLQSNFPSCMSATVGSAGRLVKLSRLIATIKS